LKMNSLFEISSEPEAALIVTVKGIAEGICIRRVHYFTQWGSALN
jgi:hypothetical protein